jgi:hypothetical protein
MASYGSTRLRMVGLVTVEVQDRGIFKDEWDLNDTINFILVI